MKNNKSLNTLLINEVYRKYQNLFKVLLPKLKDIKFFTPNNIWARFNTDDLYKQTYILYVNPELLNKSKKFIKQVLYHEFTHLLDSRLFIKYSHDDFINIMQSYSEFHASEIEMKERLNQPEQVINFNSLVINDKGYISLNELLQHKFNDLIYIINKMNENYKGEDIFYETANLYYYCGYLKAIKSFGLNCDAYKIDILKLPPTPISPICCSVFDYLMKDDIDYDTILKMHKELDDSILFSARINKMYKQD